MQIAAAVRGGARPDCGSPGFPEALRELLGRMWNASPAKRPSLRKVVPALASALQESLPTEADGDSGGGQNVAATREKRTSPGIPPTPSALATAPPSA